MARQDGFKSSLDFPGNITVFCIISFISSEQEKLADTYLWLP